MNEKLIEAAAKAIMDESHGEGSWELREPMEDTLYRRRAAAALAVFEKAHAQTDDEREDMIEFLLRDHNFEESPWGRTYTDAEIANALRHSVVPEPQSEPSDVQEAVDRLDQCLAKRDAGVGAWSMVRPEDVRTVLAALRAAGEVDR